MADAALSSSLGKSRSSITPSASALPSSSQSISISSTRDVDGLADSLLRTSLSRTSLNRTLVDQRTVVLAGGPASRRALPPAHTPADETPLPSSGAVELAVLDHSEEARIARQERDNLQRILSRAQREFATGPSQNEAQMRLDEVNKVVLRANANAPPPRKDRIFRDAFSTDLLFLIDTTRSMKRHIEAAKNQVYSIMDGIEAITFREATIRMGVVAYTDHVNGPWNIQFLDLTSDVAQVRAFIANLSLRSGGDIPEDVLGGIQQALLASWKHSNRCIVHIADAPPHGRTLHNLGDRQDQYPEPGSEPHGLTHDALLEKLIRLNITYALLRINESTDLMAAVFFQAYAAVCPNSRLDKSNDYYDWACKRRQQLAIGLPGWGKSIGQAQGMPPIFVELHLGTSYATLRDLVIRSVTTSATSCSATRTTTPGTRIPMPVQRRTAETKVVLETSPPMWDTKGWLDEVMTVEAYTTNVLAHRISMLEAMMASDEKIKLTTTDLTVHKRSKPFDQGAMRLAFYARSAQSRNRLVVKSYKKEGKTFAHLIEDMRCQALCKAFALEFNALVDEKHSLDFIVVTCLRTKDHEGKIMSLEPFLEGRYVKYNSNNGWVSEETSDIAQAAQAFSHFTFERSRGLLMVTDLQGVGRVLTDPAIQTRDPERFKLNVTNLKDSGFKFFFAMHVCNDVCRSLGLRSTAAMFISQDFKFRRRWLDRSEVPNMMICCSNKFCSRIVRMAAAKTSEAFRGYSWCDECWPELERSTVRWLCHPGPGEKLHEFRVSTFFYESQGTIPPHTCPAHRPGGRKALLPGKVEETNLSSTVNNEREGTPTPSQTCRHGASCTRMDCPFKHPVSACLRGSACTDMECPKRHPVRPCRFSASCFKLGCPYRHPEGHVSTTTVSDGPWLDAPPCRYGPRCGNMDCGFQHPNDICHAGSECTDDECSGRHPHKAWGACWTGGVGLSVLPALNHHSKWDFLLCSRQTPGFFMCLYPIPTHCKKKVRTEYHLTETRRPGDPKTMATTSEASPVPATSIDTPYRDDPNDVESTPLLIGEEAVASRPQQAAADEEQATTATRSPEDGSSPDGTRRQFNYIRFHRATLILAAIVLVILIAFLVFAVVGEHIGFHFPGHFEEIVLKALIWSLITVAWAGTSLYHNLKQRPLFPHAWGTVVHGILGFFIFKTAASSIYVLDGYYPGGRCWGYPDDDRCKILDQVFWSFCIVYFVVLFVLSILHWILFTACFTATYRSVLCTNGSEHGFSLPGGQISIEFSIRFLRQDAPPPAPIRGVSPPNPIVSSASAPASTSTAAQTTAPLIATD
ncbi:hypothetical protein V8F20_011473 [Naviculisporaceae sp. PSN 640]